MIPDWLLLGIEPRQTQRTQRAKIVGALSPRALYWFKLSHQVQESQVFSVPVTEIGYFKVTTVGF